MSKERNLETLPLNGGSLCFDFINTVHTRKEKVFHEYLPDYQQFILWCSKVQVADDARLAALAAYARKHQAESVSALEKIKESRENLYLLFSAIAADQVNNIDHKVLRNFNASLADALSHIQLEVRENHLQQAWNQDHINLLEPRWIILKSAYDLVTTEDYHRMKECVACGWLFLDQTKNNKRRWCSPSTCGSIEKSKRYYHKKKNQAKS